MRNHEILQRFVSLTIAATALALSVSAADTKSPPAAQPAADKKASEGKAPMSDEQMITSAMSAAPRKVAQRATIVAMGADGKMRTLRKGSNGFTCAVERERVETMEPECYDREGSGTTFQVRKFVEQQRAAGVSEEKIEKAVAAGYKTGRFKAPTKPGIVYMMSDSNHVFDPDSKKVIHFPGHLMFYAPYATAETVGSGEGAPSRRAGRVGSDSTPPAPAMRRVRAGSSVSITSSTATTVLRPSGRRATWTTRSRAERI